MIIPLDVVRAGWVFLCLIVCLCPSVSLAESRQPVKALYIPLADHYAALVAYEKYAADMQYADFSIQQMKSWDLLRGYFNSEDADMAFVMSPLALDMFRKTRDFRWVGLLHRDGNALAINDILNQSVGLSNQRSERKPDDKVALAIQRHYQKTGTPIRIAVPHKFSTHAVVLYQYLKNNGLSLTVFKKNPADVLAVPVAPPKSPLFIKSKSNRKTPAGFEQSLPWAELVESEGHGHIAWYSKDVIKWPNSHVECIAIAKDQSLKHKKRAIKEVMNAIHKAGDDIESARLEGGEALMEIIKIVRKHIPAHTSNAIAASLSPELNVINYKQLHIDPKGLELIMKLAVEGNVISAPVDIDEFIAEDFFNPDFTTVSHAHQ